MIPEELEVKTIYGVYGEFALGTLTLLTVHESKENALAELPRYASLKLFVLPFTLLP